MSYHIYNWCCDRFEYDPNISLGDKQEVIKYWAKHDKVVGSYTDFEIFLTWQLERFGLNLGDINGQGNRQASG